MFKANGKWMGLAIATIAAMGAMGGLASAALIVSVESVTIAPGETGYIDAFVTVDGTETESVNTFTIGLTSVPIIGGGFTGDAVRTDDAGTGGTRPMLLGAATFVPFGTDPIAGTAYAIQGFALDAPPDADAGVALAGANGLGLMRIAFTVPADAGAGSTYTIDVDPIFTSFATPGEESSLIEFVGEAGTVTVGAVPEPATIGLIALPLMALARRRRGA